MGQTLATTPLMWAKTMMAAYSSNALRLPQPVKRELVVMVGKIACIDFTIEVLIMLMFSGFNLQYSVVSEGLLDATLLTMCSSPLVYLWVARPFADAARAARTELVEQLAETRRLLEQNEKLRTSLQKMNESAAEINERMLQKIGADLHDGPAQLLSFSLLKLDRLNPGLQKAGDSRGIAELEKLRSVIAETLREVRGISTGLSLPELQGVSIEETIRLVVRRHEELTGKKIAVAMSTLPERTTLSQKTCIYRFIQEALANTFKHGDARNTRVTARVMNEVEITVADDGKGFDPDALTGTGLGLTGMRTRIQALGGRLDIVSSPGRGTTATATINLKALIP